MTLICVGFVVAAMCRVSIGSGSILFGLCSLMLHAIEQRQPLVVATLKRHLTSRPSRPLSMYFQQLGIRTRLRTSRGAHDESALAGECPFGQSTPARMRIVRKREGRRRRVRQATSSAVGREARQQPPKKEGMGARKAGGLSGRVEAEIEVGSGKVEGEQ